jgi:hypothetical protein
MYWGGFAATASIYRTFFPRIGALDALRHVITPRISYTYRPDFSKYTGHFFGLPGISGEVGKQGKMQISLDNRLQAKLESGGQVRKLNNLLSLQTSTSYDFLYKDKGLSTPFSTISNSLRFYPSQYVSFDLDFTNNPNDLDFESLNLTTRFTYTGREPLPPGFEKPDLEQPETVPEEGVGGSEIEPPSAKPWHVGVIYRFNKAFDGGNDSYWLDFQSGLNLTSRWRLEYSGRFNLSEHETAYQEYSIYRDLHCWEARFVRRYSGGTWQYYFRINIKVHPEIYTESGLRTLHRSY